MLNALMNHPMETGLRKDKKTGKMIPAHHIQKVAAKVGYCHGASNVNHQLLLSADECRNADIQAI